METDRHDKFTILLVEDNSSHAELVMRSLGEHSISTSIHHVADGEAALDYLFQRNQYEEPDKAPRPHLVLLDLRLPKIDGLQVLREIRSSEDLFRIPVVILSTSYAELDVGKAYEHHANSYLVKPLDFEKFTNLMNDLGFYWLGWNHYPFS
jgi:two-component system response regulator